MELPAFKLECYFARYEFKVRHLLCSSDCESVTVKDLLALEAGAGEALENFWLGYTESHVITSYSIHYTKLYDPCGGPPSACEKPATSPCSCWTAWSNASTVSWW